MNAIISTLLGAIQLGEPVTDAGLTLIPVFGQFDGVPDFVTLGEALSTGTLMVTEVSQDGSVPTLKARNTGKAGVLILDGEELAGAKQNRVLNTSVYLRPGAEIVIPVSCTEHGRWSYRSREFVDSGHISAHAVRHATLESVTANVRSSGAYHSDQGRVWNEVALLQDRHSMHSPTMAARDVYEGMADSLRRRETAFVRVPGQLGLLALWVGRVVGLDVVGTADSYAKLHGRLVRSYALDAPPSRVASPDADRRVAREWLVGMADAEVTQHESPGDGVSYRLSGSDRVGSVLAVDGAILHAVAFATQVGPNIDDERYPGFFERRERFPW